MNYYKHHIGDYARDTAHLSMLEDAAYRRMLDLYYASEKPLPALDALCRLIRARSKEERKAVEQILSEFFEQHEDGWHQKRCDEEIRKAIEEGEDSTARRENERERQRRHRERRKQLFDELREKGIVPTFDTSTEKLQELLRNAPVTRDVTAIHKPLANSHKPRVEKPAARACSFAVDALPPDWKAFCLTERPDLDPERTFAKFGDYWRAKPGKDGRKTDWLATWRNWVRQERAANGSGNGTGKFNPHAYGRKLLAEALAAEGVDSGPASEAVPRVPGQLLSVVPRSGND